MLPTKRFGAVFTALLGIAALVAVALHSTARGAKPSPNVVRPISYLTAGGFSFNIAMIDEEGSSSVTVNRDTVGSYPRWSPDGQLIGGYHKALGSDLAIMAMSSRDASEQAILTNGEFLFWNLFRPGVLDSTGFAVLSSNCWLGTDALIFTGDTTYVDEMEQTHTARRLFIVDTTGAITPLTESAPHSGNDRDPHWSGALNKVVFATDGIGELYAINPDGTGLQQITDFGATVRQLHWPVWSPDGNRIVVVVRPLPDLREELWILDVDLDQPNPGTGDGGRVTSIDPFKISGGNLTAAWSPDGQRLVLSRSVFDNRNRKSYELVIADATSGAETVIKRSSSNIELPDWSPVP